MAFPKYESYKDSGEDWLGEVPEHWEIIRTKNIFRLVTEPAPKNNSEELLSVYSDIGVKPRKELEERGNKASTTDGYWFVKKGDVIVNKLLAWMGAIGVSEYDGVTSPAYDILRASKPVDSKFYHYLFRNQICTSKLKQHSKGIMEMRLRLYFDEFGNIKIPYPPFEEQQRIVAFIDRTTAEIDEAIAKKQRLIELLQEQKAILINQAVTKGLNPKAPMRDSGVEWIGEIPEHWEVRRAKYIFKEVDERSKTGTEELLSVSHITGVTPRSEKNVNMFMAEDYSGSKLCQKDDIVINIMWAWMGALGVSTITGIVSPSYGVFRQLKAGIFNSWYLEHLLRSTEYVAEYNRRSTGLHSSRLRLYADMFLSMEITLPPKEEQDKIEIVTNERVADIDKAINAIEREIISLEELRSIIILQAVTGKIKV